MSTTAINSLESALRPSKKEWDLLLQRMAESTPFRRSPRLREFLEYVGNEVVLKGTEDLHEQQIGMAVFGRSRSYDTSQDNIVRVTAMELRKRIDLYFANEGRDEPVVFEIPRGSYGPVFHLRKPVFAECVAEDSGLTEERAAIAAGQRVELPAPVMSLPANPVPGRRHWLEALLVVAIICLSTGLTIEVRRNQQAQVALHRWQSGPALRSFWGNFFGQKLPPEIVLADTSFGIAQDTLHRQLSLAEYLDYSYHAASSPDPLSNDARQQEQKDLAVVFNRNSGSLGDFRVARRITEMETGEDGTRLSFAREYAGHRVRWSNTIFIGSSRSNPWVELFENRMAYHFKRIEGSESTVLTVDKPTGNEQAEYALSNDPGSKTAYCVIVFLPNPTNTGNTLIIAGSDSQATEAGGDFITSEENLERLQGILHQKHFPYFQVLLKIARSNGTPLESEIISYRIVHQ